MSWRNAPPREDGLNTAAERMEATSWHWFPRTGGLLEVLLSRHHILGGQVSLSLGAAALGGPLTAAKGSLLGLGVGGREENTLA